jgi:hypothetical protein
MTLSESLQRVLESLPEEDPRRATLTDCNRALCSKVTPPDAYQARRNLWNSLHELKAERPDAPGVTELLSRYEERWGHIVPLKPEHD